MNELKFDMKYFLVTLIGRIFTVLSNLPATYATLITVFVLWLFKVDQIVFINSAWGFGWDQIVILYSALVVGLIIKLSLTIGLKHKKFTTEYIVIFIDLLFGGLIVFLSGYWVEYVILIGTVLYLVYYAYIVTISYTRLGHNTEELLQELRIRHNQASKKTNKQKNKR